MPASALAQATGTYCDNSDYQIVSYYCGGQPDGSWTSRWDGCFIRKVKGACSAAADRSPVFDGDQYGQYYGDVAAAGVNRLDHWRQWGKAEGRASSRSFIVREYAQQNNDVAAAFGQDWATMVQHYVNNGIHEGRVTRSNEITAPGYPVKAFNPDFGQQFPADGNYNISIFRYTSAAVIPDSTLNSNTQYDTSPVTGMPNPYRLGAGTTLKAPPQALIDSQFGFLGVQQYGGQVGIAIDSRSFKNELNEYGRWVKSSGRGDAGIATIVLGRSWQANANAPRPWAQGQVLRTGLTMSIPFAGGAGPGGAASNGSQVVDYYFIRDYVNGGTLALGVTMFDTRASAGNDVFLNSPGPGFKIFTIPLKHQFSQYITMPSYSAEFQSTTNELQQYREYTITRDNLVNILNRAIQQGFPNLSNNPDNYEVTNYVFNPETFGDINPDTFEWTGDGWIGLRASFNQTGAANP
jgi:hypothetical protein